MCSCASLYYLIGKGDRGVKDTLGRKHSQSLGLGTSSSNINALMVKDLKE